MKASLYLFFAALAFSFYPLLNTIGLGGTSPFLLALLVQLSTLLVGFISFSIVQNDFAITLTTIKDYWKLPFEIKIVPFLSGIGIYLGGIFFLFALSLMSKAGASLIMETWPILAIFIAPVVLYKKWNRFDPIDGLLILLSIAGLLCITAAEENITLDAFLKNPLFLFNGQDFYGHVGILMAFLSAICFAGSSIARSYFASVLPEDFRISHFGQINTLKESVFAYFLTYLYGLPLALLSFLIMEDQISFEFYTVAPVIFIGVSLVITSSFYSYALLITENSNINLIWYVSPLLAALWLALFGYSQITEMLILGGLLIIIANVILILKSRKAKSNHV